MVVPIAASERPHSAEQLLVLYGIVQVVMHLIASLGSLGSKFCPQVM